MTANVLVIAHGRHRCRSEPTDSAAAGQNSVDCLVQPWFRYAGVTQRDPEGSVYNFVGQLVPQNLLLPSESLRAFQTINESLQGLLLNVQLLKHKYSSVGW